MKVLQGLFCVAIWAATFSLVGCGAVSENMKGLQSGGQTESRSDALFAQGDYDGAFKENQKALGDGRGEADVALFNMGLISAYSLNPKKDYATAFVYFRKVVQDYPHSKLTEQAKVWIQVLEEHQRVMEEKQKLAEEKKTLTRERELLSQERERLKQTVEKSRQVDIDIENRRRQTQTK